VILTSKLESEMEIVKRHIHILNEVIKNQPIGIIKLAQITNLPEHKVRYSLRVLEQEKLVEPTPEGARATKRAKKEIKSVRKVLEDIISDSESVVKEIDEIEKI